MVAMVALVALAACSAASASQPIRPDGSVPPSLVAMPVSSAASASSGLMPPASESPPATVVVGVSPAPTSPMRGQVIHIDTSAAGQATGFTMRTADGQRLAFTVGLLANTGSYPAASLPEHLASGQPILVFFRVAGDKLVAYRLIDAALVPSGGLPFPMPSGHSPSDAPPAS